MLGGISKHSTHFLNIFASRCIPPKLKLGIIALHFGLKHFKQAEK